MLTCLSKIAMGVVMVCEELVHYSPSMEQLHDLSEDDIITFPSDSDGYDWKYTVVLLILNLTSASSQQIRLHDTYAS